MRELNWRGCYDKNLKGVICDEAFSHPAKFAYGLICRIYAHLLERGWLQGGDLVADPFAGCGIGGIVAAANGLRWIGIELEQKFIDLTVGFDCDGIVERHQEEVWVEPRPSGWFVRLRIRAQYWDASGESSLGGPKGDGWGTEQEAQAFADSIADSEEVQGYPLSTLYWEPVEGHYATKWVCDKPAKCGNCEPHDPHHVTGSFELHQEQWEKMGKPHPMILQGDSRQFASIIKEAVEAIVTSPPFGVPETRDETPYSGGAIASFMEKGAYTQRRQGKTEGQIGAMKEGKLDEVVAVITSPPFLDSLATKAKDGSLAAQGLREDGTRRGGSLVTGDYGQSEGQLGGMPEGDHAEVVDSIVTSPPYSHSMSSEKSGIDWSKCKREDGRPRDMTKEPAHATRIGAGGEMRYSPSPDNVGNLPEGNHAEVVDSIVASPPYPEVISTGERRDIQKAIEAEERYLEAHPELRGKRPKLHLYGDSKGQIGHLHEGDHGAVINGIVTSPPYSEIRQDGGSLREGYGGMVPYTSEPRDTWRTQRDQRNMGNLPEGDHAGVVDGIVTSPPYADSMTRGGHLVWQEQGRVGAHKDSKGKEEIYSADPANMGNLPEGSHEAVVDAVVTSPPYERSMDSSENAEARAERADGFTQGMKTLKYGENPYGFLARDPSGLSNEERHRVAAQNPQIGQKQGDTYWEAVSKVYQECFKALRPNGVCCIVVKAFVRNKKIVDLPSQTLELLEAIGFEPLERIRAWMTSPVTQKSLMPDMVEDYTKKKASFFRRLYESKYPENKIDFEEVLIVRKPISDCH